MTEDRAADALREKVAVAEEPKTPLLAGTQDDMLCDLHARYHCQTGNLLGRDECGWERCEFWAAAKHTLDELDLPALLAAERAKAWDEGWSAAYTMARNWGHVDGWEDEWPDNPYRAEPAPGEGASR